ncbi:HAD-IIIA family hydrolase [Rubrobacter calidifluminis]|uniref:HAD-IIIA family hydrolase n=1 Tax=Rubrobacter calidifluminis TaxID=1392640 RepID=UPI00235E7E1E|nr:HAD-IIIA family hydrolase [Rubrobacter calidifluminis]
MTAKDRPPVSVDVVIPTSGRSSLAELLSALASGSVSPPGWVVLVDDRRSPDGPLLSRGAPGPLRKRLLVVRGRAAGPAAARNTGWRASGARWVAFLDDDVIPAPDWMERLLDDLSGLKEGVAASQGNLRVPLPKGRRPTDWERNVRGLEGAPWITADIAYRRRALARLGGFDERFPRAYREDADLALRATRAGYTLVRGERTSFHPVRPAPPFVSLRLQSGNADDALMLALHGRGWWRAAKVPAGRRPGHLATTAAGTTALLALLARRRRPAVLALSLWMALTAEFAASRLAPGPGTPREVAAMLATSALIPPAASAHWLRGLLRARSLLRDDSRAPHPLPVERLPEAVIFDRDGTLVRDVPYNRDPGRVEPVPGAREALQRLRASGIALGIATNQSGVARGLIDRRELLAVNQRVEELVGPLGFWAVCPHAPEEGCQCRKPAPGLVLRAARALSSDPSRCVVVGDTGADVEAARTAGARAILVPTPATRPEEIRSAPEVAPDLPSAVDLILGETL